MTALYILRTVFIFNYFSSQITLLYQVISIAILFKYLPLYCPFVRWIHRFHKRPAMLGFDVSFDVSLNEPLKNGRSCDVTMVKLQKLFGSPQTWASNNMD